MKQILNCGKKVITFIYNIVFRHKILSPEVHISAKIGKNVKIDKDVLIDGNTTIGAFSFIGRGTIITKATIGNYCSIAPGVKIGLGEHNYKNFSTSVYFLHKAYSELTEKACSLGHDVWVGTDAVIMRGVSVGNGAVVGSNAVVTKDVPPYSIVVGIPAKVIKYRFSELTIEELEKSEWWENDVKIAKNIINERVKEF